MRRYCTVCNTTDGHRRRRHPHHHRVHCIATVRVDAHASNIPQTRYHPNNPGHCSHADGVGAGTIEIPLATAPSGAEEADGVEAEPDVDAALRLDKMTLAWLGTTTTVVALESELAWSVGYDEPELGYELEFELEPEEEPLLLGRTILDRSSITMSMKTISGPATIALLCLSTAWPFTGWSSDVIQIATGPLIPFGTTHWLRGREREKGMPPVSIWQWKPCELIGKTLPPCEKHVVES